MTTADRVALLNTHKALMDGVERGAGFTAENMEKFKEMRRGDYNLLLIREATIGEWMATSIRKRWEK